MKRVITISFLSIYLLATTEISQLLKLPMLIEHYREHKQENTEISLLEFLSMHYAHGNVHDADYDKDMKLPFKTHDGCTNSASPLFIPNNFSTEVVKTISIETRSFPVYQENFSSNSFLSNIWQPPRLG